MIQANALYQLQQKSQKKKENKREKDIKSSLKSPGHNLTLCIVILFKNDCEIATVVSNWWSKSYMSHCQGIFVWTAAQSRLSFFVV